jgi:hypothetical protein
MRVAGASCTGDHAAAAVVVRIERDGGGIVASDQDVVHLHSPWRGM